MLTQKTGTKREILECLRTDNEATIDELIDQVDVSRSTLSEHLSDLQAMDLIDKRSERDGPGRPHYLYFLTRKAEKLFPHAYAKLASLLLEVMESLADKERIRDRLTDAMERHVQQFDSLEVALQSIGFYPDMDAESTDSDDESTIVFHQCPFDEVAREHPVLCDVDERMLQSMTGKMVTKSCCIADGEQQCEFVLSET